MRGCENSLDRENYCPNVYLLSHLGFQFGLDLGLCTHCALLLLIIITIVTKVISKRYLLFY